MSKLFLAALAALTLNATAQELGIPQASDTQSTKTPTANEARTLVMVGVPLAAPNSLSVFSSADGATFTTLASEAYADDTLRDPSLLRADDGTYYVSYTARDGVAVIRSRDLKHWERTDALPAGTARSTASGKAAAANMLASASVVAVDRAAFAQAVQPKGRPKRIGWDQYSMTVDGQRVVVWSGEIHPFRLPSPSLWRDVLQKMKAVGFNAVAFYFDWGYHSPAPGV